MTPPLLSPRTLHDSAADPARPEDDLMPPRPRRKPAPVTGSARRTHEPDVLDPGATAAVAGRSRKARGGTAAATVEEVSTPVGHVAQVEEAATPPKKIQRSFYVDVAILEDARAAVTYLGAYVPEAGVKSLADLVNPGLAAVVQQLQDTYNDGKPFRRVSHMQAGRPPRQ